MISERIKKAIDVFLDAVNNGTLAKGSCSACAVGNLIVAGMGGEVVMHDEPVSDPFLGKTYNRFANTLPRELSSWGMVFCTSNQKQVFTPTFLTEEIKGHIESTGFSLEELMQIEYTFERNTNIDLYFYPKCDKEVIREDQIRGLTAVIELMKTFEEKPQEFSVQEEFVDKLSPICA